MLGRPGSTWPLTPFLCAYAHCSVPCNSSSECVCARPFGDSGKQDPGRPQVAPSLGMETNPWAVPAGALLGTGILGLGG